MNDRVGGQRPRPRVALLGAFRDDDMNQFARMFPTIWRAPDVQILDDLVDPRELDLIVIASDVEAVPDRVGETNVICFSQWVDTLPGPLSWTWSETAGPAETEEFFLPNIPLQLGRLRDSHLLDVTHIRGWTKLHCRSSTHTSEVKSDDARDILGAGAILIERATGSPLGTHYVRADLALGVAWLPFATHNQAGWVDAVVAQWAPFSKTAFPGFADWMTAPEWMVPEELELSARILALEQRRKHVLDEIQTEIAQVSTQLTQARSQANAGLRRLITAQDTPLVEEVANVLSEIGFGVVHADLLLGEGEPKREDLRLQCLAEGRDDWNAIAEVRGYKKSGGTIADLSRLYRFATLYEKETGHPPSNLIYIVNGELQLLPSLRQEPLAPASEDVEVFAENKGILIWSVDLFRAMKETDPSGHPALLQSIKTARGRWRPPNTPQPDTG